MCMLCKHNIKQVHGGSIFLPGEISSPQLAVYSGTLLACFSVTQESSSKPIQACTWVFSSLTVYLDECECPGRQVSKGVSTLTCTVFHPLMAQGSLDRISHRSMPNGNPSPRYSFLAGLNCNHLSSYASSLVLKNYLKTKHHNECVYYTSAFKNKQKKRVTKYFLGKAPTGDGKRSRFKVLTFKEFIVQLEESGQTHLQR